MNILLVDDDPTLRDLIAMALKGDDHSVVAAVGQFDLVLSDVAMPMLDGLGLAKALLAIDPSQKVILLSGDADGVQEKPPNVKAVLNKPISFAELNTTIREFGN